MKHRKKYSEKIKDYKATGDGKQTISSLSHETLDVIDATRTQVETFGRPLDSQKVSNKGEKKKPTHSASDRATCGALASVLIFI